MRRALAITAKAPQPGKVKTRLLEILSIDEATELYRRFVKDTLLLVNDIPGVEVIVSYTPRGAEEFFDGIIANGERLICQRGDGLSEIIINAFEDFFRAGFDSVTLMNADSPTLPQNYIKQAVEYLDRPGDRVVLGPAEDGGYYLVGLKQLHRRLFEQITWSSEKVLNQTIERAREINLEVALLPEWYDVDGPAGFERLKRELIASSLSTDSRINHRNLPAPHTREFILSLHPFIEPGGTSSNNS